VRACTCHSCLFSLLGPKGGRKDTINDVLNLGDCKTLDGPGVWHGDLNTGDSLHRGIQVVESFTLHHDACDLCADAVLWPALFHTHHSVGLLHRLDETVAVQRLNGSQVDDFSADVVITLEHFSGLKGEADHLSVSSDSDISACSLDLGLANRDQKVFVHNCRVYIKFNTVHHFVLEEHDGVVVADRCLEETTAVLDVPWANNLEAWDLTVPGSKALRVLGTDTR